MKYFTFYCLSKSRITRDARELHEMYDDTVREFHQIPSINSRGTPESCKFDKCCTLAHARPPKPRSRLGYPVHS